LNIYQGLFIFSSDMKDEAVNSQVQYIQAEIVKLKGKVDETHALGKQMFARPMDKQENGQYVRIIFQLDAAGVDPLQARLKLNDAIFRTQIVRAGKIITRPKAPAAVPAAKAEDGAPVAG
jgi:ribosomal protein S6